MIFPKPTLLLPLAAAALLTACDLPFLADEEAKIEAKRQAEGQAVGSGCRYSARPLEECYGMNPKMSKAAIFAGWREMDAYMRDNNIAPVLPPKEEPAPKAAEAAPAAEEKPKTAEVPAGKAGTPAPAAAAAAAAATPLPPPPIKRGISVHGRGRRVAAKPTEETPEG